MQLRSHSQSEEQWPALPQKITHQQNNALTMNSKEQGYAFGTSISRVFRLTAVNLVYTILFLLCLRMHVRPIQQVEKYRQCARVNPYSSTTQWDRFDKYHQDCFEQSFRPGYNNEEENHGDQSARRNNREDQSGRQNNREDQSGRQNNHEGQSGRQNNHEDQSGRRSNSFGDRKKICYIQASRQSLSPQSLSRLRASF
jgi:hypothetical protein